MNRREVAKMHTNRTRTLRTTLGVVVMSAVLFGVGCRSGSDASSGTDSGQSTGVPVLDAVAYSRPSMALDGASDRTLDRHGDVLFNQHDLSNGYVLDDQWCDSATARCVAVSGDDTVQFGEEPLESFILKTEYRVDDPDIEVVKVRALHHPVTDQLRLSLHIRSSEGTWGTEYTKVRVSSDSGETETSLDGPAKVVPGVVTRYEIRPIAEPVSGRVKLLISFTDGIQDGEAIHLTIGVDDNAPDITRVEAPLDSPVPVAVYRSSKDLPDDDERSDDESDDDDEVDSGQAIEALIAAIVDGKDTSDLVAEDSPGALAVLTLSDAKQEVTPRRDPENPRALCWQTTVRGTFCERWHAGTTDGDVLTSWSVEGTPIDDLVVSRAGSFPGASVTLLRSATTDVVLAATTVTNTTSSGFFLTMYDPRIERDGFARNALTATGGYEVLEGSTEKGTAVIASKDLAFDLVYPQGSGVDGGDIRFDADAGPATEGGGGSNDDLETASVRLASLLQTQRFDDAAAEAAPGSPAETYLNAASSVFSEIYFWIDDGDDPVGSKRTCANDSSSVTCTTIEVTALDGEGRVSSFTIEDVDVEELLIADKSTESGDFTATVNAAILWPKWGVFVEWSVINESDADITIDSLNFVTLDKVIIESERGVYEDVPANRTVTGVAYYDTDSLNGGVELTGRGRGAVRSVNLAVPLTESFEATTSTVELESDETELETPGGTELTIPGDWSDGIWWDEETGKIAGDGTSLKRVKAIHRGDMSILAFSPEFSPAELSSDQLVAEINTLAPLTDVETGATTTPQGDPTTVIQGTTDFFPEPRPALIFPGETDLVFLVWEETVPEDAEEFVAVVTALTEQLEVVAPG